MCVDHYYEQVPLWSRIPHIYDINISFTSEVQIGPGTAFACFENFGLVWFPYRVMSIMRR